MFRFQVPPVDYFKHVILELQNESSTIHLQQAKSSIRGLQKRFDEVSILIDSLKKKHSFSLLNLKMS